jgi:hypothetical protein
MGRKVPTMDSMIDSPLDIQQRVKEMRVLHWAEMSSSFRTLDC